MPCPDVDHGWGTALFHLGEEAMARFGTFHALAALGIAAFTLGIVAVPVAHGQAMPIALTGYDTDVITDADKTVRFADGYDGGGGSDGGSAWFENGAVDDRGVLRDDDGLPAGKTFMSAISNTMYMIQPANGMNSLRIDGAIDSTKTLTLATPAAYSAIYVLASGGSGGDDGTTGPTGTIHYADGSSLPFTYVCRDWCNNSNYAEAALPNLGRSSRGSDGTAFGYLHECYFALYETKLATDSTKMIKSVDFDPDPVIGKINVMAISGQ
jgi:hypothetical protein